MVAVCDVRRPLAEAIAARFGVSFVTDEAEALLAHPLVEAVLVSVPDPLHSRLILNALDMGRHVLVEKPMCATLDECRTVVKAVERTGLKLQVGAMKRHDPGLQYAYSSIRQHLGQIESFSAWYRVSSFRSEFEATLIPPEIQLGETQHLQRTYKSELQRYYLVTHGVHLFDTVRYLLGDVEALIASHLSTETGTQVWHGLMRLREGGIGNFELSVPVHSDWAEGFEVQGERGCVSGRTFFPFFLRPSEVRFFQESSATWTVPLLADSDPYERQLEAFARAIANDEPASPDAWDGLAAMELIERVATSSNNGEWDLGPE